MEQFRSQPSGNGRALTLRGIGLTGAVLYLTLFCVTFADPQWLERFAADYVESEAKARAELLVANATAFTEGDSVLGKLAGALHAQNEERIRTLKTALETKLHTQWVDALARVRDMDCECRQKWEAFLESSLQSQIVQLAASNEQIQRLIHASYMDVVTELKRDARIFSLSSAIIFLLLLITSFMKPQAMMHLYVPGLLLGVSTLVCSYCYLFEQNWLMTIIHSSYLGFAYLGWVGVVFLFLVDIILNRARVTTEVVNAISNVLGSAASLSPC